MSVSYMNQEEGTKRLAQLLHEEKLVPIFGSGFTQGCLSYNGSVPCGKKATQLMQELILQTEYINLDNIDFNKMSDRFFAIVSTETIHAFLRNYFTKVVIDEYKKDFLSLPWSYAYTLNIDDGIERTGLFTPILPYNSANVPNTSINLLYKLHGDAMHEIKYDIKQNLVFSVSQYIESLTSKTNSTFINSISNDYKQKNLLFIGCSLINEPDIKYIYSNVKPDLSENIIRAVLRTRKLSRVEELDMADYGINTVIIVEDYELFYRSLVREYQVINSSSKPYQFLNPKHKNIGDNKKKTLLYFSGHNIFDEENNFFYLSGMQIIRTCINKIETHLEKSNSVVVRGRRFSGKTFVLSCLAERFNKYSVFYFPSSTLEDEDIVRNLLSTNENSIFLFDSNSLTDHAYHFVANSENILIKNHNKVVIAINSNDSYLSDSLNAEIIDINPKFDEQEIRLIEPLADYYGLLRRQPKMTNIDYLNDLSNQQKINFSVFNDLPKKFTLHESAVLMLLCIKDKLYFSDITALNIRFHDIDILISRMKIIIERIPVAKGERSRHSAEKLVHNSKYFLLSIMRSLSTKDIVSCVYYIVSHLVSDHARKRLYVEAVLFDTLNQLFGSNNGAGTLIFSIYEALETILNQDMDYWLQRAKSIYRLMPYDYCNLKNAYQYAKKALGDGDPRLQAKAALTTSLICCLLSKLVQDESELQNYELEAINCAYTAIICSDYFTVNHSNLRGELSIGKRKSYDKLIIEICTHHLNDLQDLQIVWKATKIKSVLQESKIK